jgi:hypothetical protein
MTDRRNLKRGGQESTVNIPQYPFHVYNAISNETPHHRRRVFNISEKSGSFMVSWGLEGRIFCQCSHEDILREKANTTQNIKVDIREIPRRGLRVQMTDIDEYLRCNCSYLQPAVPDWNRFIEELGNRTKNGRVHVSRLPCSTSLRFSKIWFGTEEP